MPAVQTQRMPTMQRTATIRRQLRGEQLGQRYMSVDFATLGREAIRGMLNPGGRPASELNPLAIFAGEASAPCMVTCSQWHLNTQETRIGLCLISFPASCLSLEIHFRSLSLL